MRYLTAEEILGIHLRVVELTGGVHGMRDPGLLALIVEKPKLALGGRETFGSAFEKAAAYYQALARGHLFTDGNKRTSLIAALTFLELNGVVVTVSDRQAEAFTLRVVSDRLEVPTIAAWLREHSRKR